MNKTHDVVEVLWRRTTFVPGEEPIKEARDERDEVVAEVGFLINEDNDKFVVARQIIAADCCDISIIPKGAVVQISHLDATES